MLLVRPVLLRPALCALVLSLVAGVRAARAEATKAEPVPEAEPGAEAEPTAEVVVRGEAAARSASETRRDQSVLGAAPHGTASDLLSTVPGVFITQHSGEGKAHQIYYRGFDAIHGQDLEIWAGGAPVNEVSNVHGQGYADLHFLMPEIVREVRAYPGTYDPRQGDFAVAGSMAFELGFAEPGVTAKASLGSYGARRAFVAYHPASESEATFAAAEIASSDGYGVGRAAERASGVGQVEFELGAGYRGRLLASSYAGRFGSAGVLRLADVESGKLGRFSSYDTDQGGHSTRTQLVFSVERRGASGEFGLAPYFVRRGLTLRSNYTGYLEDPVNGDSVEQENHASTLGARTWFRRRVRFFSEQDAFETGLSVRSDFIDQADRRIGSVDDRVTRTLVDAEVQATGVGAYVDLELHPVRRVRVSGGVRGDAVSFAVRGNDADTGANRSAQGTHFGGKATLDVGLVPGVHAVASYGDGFRSPQARSLADGERAPFTSVRSQEVGVRARDPQIEAAVSAYRTALSDDLVFDEATSRNVTAPSTLRLGFVVDVVARPAEWFTSALGFTYTRSTFTESGGRYQAGDLVPFVPQVVLRADAALKRRFLRVSGRELAGRLGAAASFLYRRPLPLSELGSNVALLDAESALRWGEFELSLEVWNVFDRDHFDGEFVYASNFERGTVPSALPARHVTAGAPRTVLVSFSLTI